MPPYDDWNNIDDEEDELQDSSFLDSKRDVILFCIDCSPSMLATHDDPTYEDLQSSHLYTALESAVQIQKKKVIVGPADSVGILFFNTEGSGVGSEIKQGNYIYQHITPTSAPKIQELMQLLEAAREDPTLLAREFPPLAEGTRVPMGDVFTSCNWVLRDEAPKTASKRVFLITDCDDPHQGVERLLVPAKTTLVDLTQAGVTVEPFFISDPARPFDPSKFYTSILLPAHIDEGEDDADAGLPDRLSITRIDDLLAQMRFHEVPKRALFSITMSFPPSSAKGSKDGEGMKIGIKGYGLVTEQKKGSYKYFVDLGDVMVPAAVRSVYLDEDQQAPVPRSEMLFGMSLGATAAAADDEDEEGDGSAGHTRTVPAGSRPYFTAEDVRDFRTLGLEPGIRLLGFKDASELRFEDQVKHSLFLYPDEMSYAGSKRTFTALLRSMVAKNKIGLALAITRRNSAPIFCALLPQREEAEEGSGGWGEPGGFHLIPLPFADDLRAAPVEKGCRAGEETRAAAAAWIGKLCVKNGSYPPDSYPNPSLAYHNAQLEASAFSEEFDPEAFEDLTLPKIDVMHKRAGPLLKEWKLALMKDEAASQVIETTTTGTKRKVAATDVDVDESEIRSKYEDGTLSKDFLKSKSQPVSGKKGELIERIAEWLDSHP
ncbi:Ku DNA-binding complex, Ku70 subunit [Athelia psychrophila]|uniref:ATP-dependent DNA helicase II subunit 1 n=1 Tax=Athelia psychrophila TaxID=1759441 RepID=A0A165ZDU5_9AGAM|nr:Ku DNA-binding complex, Ku70 subunit [Fibularhizoctonia sp. CBS 109695]